MFHQRKCIDCFKLGVFSTHYPLEIEVNITDNLSSLTWKKEEWVYNGQAVSSSKKATLAAHQSAGGTSIVCSVLVLDFGNTLLSTAVLQTDFVYKGMFVRIAYPC